MDDEQIYNEILDELRETGPRQGLWAKCFTEANGNENAAKALYFKYRAEQISKDRLAAKVEPSSAELVRHEVDNGNTISKTSSNPNAALYIWMLLFVVGLVGWLVFNQYQETELRRVQEHQAPTITLPKITAEEEIEQRKEKEANLKIVFSAYFKDQTNFKFPVEDAKCALETSNAGYSHCLFDLAKRSRIKLNDQKDKLLATTTDSKLTQAITKTYLLQEKLADSWCNTFIDATWGGGSGVGQGVASCELSTNEWLGQAINVVADKHAGNYSSSASIFKITDRNSSLNRDCFNETCLRQMSFEIPADIRRYETEIKTYLLTERSQKKYELTRPPGREKWIESLTMSSSQRNELIDLICKNILTGYETEIDSRYPILCNVALNSYWLDTLKIQYESLVKD
ncbi:MAG: hypothetical protein Q7T07_20420 [Burkholderiaceae bacterium]|nr:hypothetical protein [Burkholderiaceae bacterium]